MSGKCVTAAMFSLIHNSSNRKTGAIAVSTSPSRTCPSSCPFLKHGCYGKYGHVGMWWNRLSEVVGDMDKSYGDFLLEVKKIPKGYYWRHNQAGDLYPAVGFKSRISLEHARLLSEASKGIKAFGYTHYPVVKVRGVSEETVRVNRRVIEEMCLNGFAMNVSANSIVHADQIMDSGIKAPVVTVLSRSFYKDKVKSSLTPKGRKVVTCPATIRDGVTCLSCKLCLKRNRDFIIGFPAHGTGFNFVEKVLKEWENGVPE